MTHTRRPNFSTEFKLEAAQLVVDQNYSVRQAAEAVNVSSTSMDKRARQLREERNGTSSMPNALTRINVRSRDWKSASTQRRIIAKQVRAKVLDQP